MPYVHIEMDELLDTLEENIEELRGTDIERLLKIVEERIKGSQPLSVRNKRSIKTGVKNMIDIVKKWNV